MSDVKSLSREELLSLFGNTVKVPRNDIQTMGDLADRTRSDNVKGSTLMTKGAFKVNGEKVRFFSDQIVSISRFLFTFLPLKMNLSRVPRHSSCVIVYLR